MTFILIIIAVLYIGFCLFFYFFQHFFFFRPEVLPSSFKFKYEFPFEELDFEMEDGGHLNVVYFKVPNARGVIYYLKGNSRSVKGWGKFAKDFLSNGYDFIMLDYRGFGKSKGKRTEKTLFNDAQFLYKWLKERYDEEKITVFGRSFGSGIAARIASWNNPNMLILDSPYYSFYHNVKRHAFFIPLKMLMRYPIRTDLFLKDFKNPIHIIHGSKDRLIPFSQSEKLRALYPQIQLYKIEGGKHNNLPEYEEFFETLYDILDVNADTNIAPA